jgi:outer membrane protein assembly factor BamB
VNRFLPIVFALAGCKGKHATHDDARPPPRDAASIDAPAAWKELADLPQIDAVRIVALPIDRGRPRGDAYGPITAFDIAVVSSPQLGFVGVDYKTGTVVWNKPGGEHVAPPVAVADGFVLISDCARTETAPLGERVLGCLRVVSPTGADRSYGVIHGKAALAGADQVWAIDAHTVRWRNQRIDIVTGAATETTASDPPLVVHYKKKSWEVAQTPDGKIAAKGTPPWQTERSYTTLLGAVYLPEQSPMLRLSSRGHYGGAPELLLFDIDATGSLHGQVARPVPGTELVAHAIDAVGDVALAVHLADDRDFIAGYAANALLMWVYPLPPKHRPIGVAVAPDAVVVFCDGDTLRILPELSAPPTAPGAARAPSENPTP